MSEFIKYEESIDYWRFKPSEELDYSIFEKLDYSSWFKKEKEKISTRLNCHDNSTEPSKQQISTLNFVLEKQEEILSSLFDYYQKVIFPVCENSIDIEKNEIAYSVSELNKVFGIIGVEIPQLKEEKDVYYLLQFDFRYDDEHGLYILFKNTSAIDFFAIGEENYDAIQIQKVGLENENGEPLKFNLYHLNGQLVNGQLVFKGNSFYDEQIESQLEKGTYRIFITCNQRRYCINFHVSNRLEKFSLKQILTIE